MAETTLTQIRAQCCIAGGGPCGIMLGLLLARAGVEVVVLEKHADFLRDFRGDTVHASTLELMHELGILEKFLKRPHQEVKELGGQIGDEYIPLADFSHLSAHCKFIALMPQWDFLNFLTEEAKIYPNFRLMMRADVTDLLEENGRIVGVKATTEQGVLTVRAELTIGADGRRSVVRERAGLQVIDVGAPMDVLWMRLSRKNSDPPQTLGRIGAGHMFIMLNRDEYWQCAFIIPKGGLAALKEKGIEAFRASVISIAPFVHDRVAELKGWDDISLLTVKVDHLQKWYRAGLLCIGDAAHAMSPVGGVGINLAVQDAVAAANILAAPLLKGECTERDLLKVQERRSYPTHATQAMQVFIQNQLVKNVLSSTKQPTAPLLLKLFCLFPALRRVPGHVIGIGFRPEHVKKSAEPEKAVRQG